MHLLIFLVNNANIYYIDELQAVAHGSLSTFFEVWQKNVGSKLLCLLCKYMLILCCDNRHSCYVLYMLCCLTNIVLLQI